MNVSISKVSLSVLAACSLFIHTAIAEDVKSESATKSASESASESALESDNCFPRGELRGDPVNGKALHVEHCVACHGLTGQADVVVMHMDETPPDQSDPEYMQTLSDGYLYIAICRGGEGVGKSYVMSPWGDFFTDQEIKDMVAWVRTFSDT